ncbi:hypothetical protein OC845_000823 [Tilletia horrida]|nr:hypothetical protein OC845_000823 [Tilletia horrida]
MASMMTPSFHDDLAPGSEFDFSEYNSPASISKKANFKTPSRRDSVRRMKALQATASISRSSPILPSSNSPIISQDAYIPLPTQPSNSSIHSGFTPGGPIPNNFSYLARSNSLATSTRPNRPKGLERSDSGRSIQQQKPFSPTLPSPSIAQLPLAHTSSRDEPAPETPAKPSYHRQGSSSSDVDQALKRTMHARPPSVENILAELDAADAEAKQKQRQSSISRPKGEVSRRAAEYVSSISSDENDLTHSTMRRVPKKQEVPSAFNAEIGIVPASEPRKPGAILPIESPSLDRVIPRRSQTLSSFPTRSEEISSSFGDERSSMRKRKIAEKAAQLPANPKTWLPSQVAVYLSHVLGFTPQPVVDDVTAFVRAARMTGNIFLRLRQDDLVKAGLNRKWQNLILESVKVLRRDCQVWGIDSGSEESLLSQTNADDPSVNGVKPSVDASTIPPVDIAALRAGYLQVAPTATSAMRGSVRRIKDRQAVKGMIQAFETWREADFCEGEEDAFVALNSGRARRASHSGSIDSLDDDEESDEDEENEDDENVSSVRQRRREVKSIQAIYGQGFVRRRAESYSSLSDAEHDAQAQIDAEVDGDRSISRARAEARRKRLASQQADDELVNAWIESLTDEEAQALANELEAKDILERGLLKPLIETAQHVKEVSGASSCSSSAASSTGSVRDDLKILLGSVNQTTLAQHDLLSVVPSLGQGEAALLSGEDSDGSPVVNLKTLPIEGGLVSSLPLEAKGTVNAARVPTFTPVSQDILLAIFADNGADESTEPRMDQEIDRFLSIKPSQSADSEAVRTHKANPLPLPVPPSQRPSRYADVGEGEDEGEEDAFGTTRRRRQHASMPSGASELASLFPMDAASENAAFLPGDEVHATVKAAHLQNLSSTSSSLADDELEISETGSIRVRAKKANAPVAPVAEEEAVVEAPIADQLPVSAEETVDEASVAPEETKEADVATSPTLEVDTVSSLPEWTAPSVRDIFGLRPESEATAPIEERQPATEAEEEVEVAAINDEPIEEAEIADAAVEEESEEINASTAEEPAAADEIVDLAEPAEESNTEGAAELDEISQDTETRPSVDAPEDVSGNTVSPGDETQPSNPSLSASKVPTPTLQAKRDASLEFGDVSGLDLNVDLSELDPIEPSGEKIPVPLTMLAPAPDGKGSIKKRSMVLVDRRRFESLARRMGALEEQLAGLETATSVAGSTAGDTQGRQSSLLRNMFDAPSDSSFTSSSSVMRDSVDAAAQTAATPSTPERNHQANMSILSSPEFADLDREFRDEMLGDDEDEDRWAGPRTVLGAIPSYMLGLGAGIGFVIVSEVLQRAARFTR